MTDLELTRLCAAAMGIEIAHTQYGKSYYVYHPMSEVMPVFALYDPLHDDAQAMALVRQFHIALGWNRPGWSAFRIERWVPDADLNRAICLCVAKMQQAKT